MIRSALITIVLGLGVAMARCATDDEPDTNFLQSYGVAKLAYEKISHHQPLSLDDIGALTQVGATDRFIVDYLQTTHVNYHVSDDDMLRLHQLGLGARAMRYLWDTAEAKK